MWLWRSVVCEGNWYVGISAIWGKWHGRPTVCWVSLRSVISLMSVVCEASGMLGQQYVESKVWEVSECCMRSAVCCVSGVGSMVCMVSCM